MSTDRFTSTATRLVDAFGTRARSAIEACRTGGDRLGDLAADRWDRSFEQASPRLTPETRRNASHARDVFARCYRGGLAVGTQGATVAVDAVVQVAGTAIERAAALRAARG